MCCLLAAAISLAPDNVRGVNEAQCVCVSGKEVVCSYQQWGFNECVGCLCDCQLLQASIQIILYLLLPVLRFPLSLSLSICLSLSHSVSVSVCVCVWVCLSHTHTHPHKNMQTAHTTNQQPLLINKVKSYLFCCPVCLSYICLSPPNIIQI